MACPVGPQRSDHSPMPDSTPNERDAGTASSDRDVEAELDAPDEDESDLEDEPPDESSLMGKSGVEEEVLAELARVEAELAEPNAPDEPPGEEGAEI